MRQVRFRFSDLEAAIRFAQGNRMGIVLGDDERFWVSTHKEISILEKEGYEKIMA